MTRPLVLLDPHPRTAAEIFRPAQMQILRARYEVVERGAEPVDTFYARYLPDAMAILGQPDLDADRLTSAVRLRAIINVEGNFLQNMDYARCFQRGIHVLSISPVFAQPVAELGLGLTLALARDIHGAHEAMRQGCERYGLDGNRQAVMLRGADVGFIGFGDLGRALHGVLAGFGCRIRIHDPWLSDAALAREGLTCVPLDELLGSSEVIYALASVTADSVGAIGAEAFARMRPGTLFLLLSRADVVDFTAMAAACRRGHIRAATDVFPHEPLPADDPLRHTPNLLLSAHRAGALQSALFEIGERIVADLEMIANGLPPQNLKRAERELAGRTMSKPVSAS